MAFHPFDALYKTGFTVTVNTDNRLVSNTTLSKEVKSLADTFRYGIADLLTFQLNAAKSLFLAREERQQVVDMLLQSYRPS